MTARKRGLGRGLDALIGASGLGQLADQSSGGEAPELRQLPIDVLRPGKYQPRRDFNDGALEELANSIRAQGLIQPIVVRPLGPDRYEIVAGERRWRAAQLAGLAEIPALVRDVPDEAAIAMALIENIQRENLNAIEEATALVRLQQEFGLTHEQIAESVGKSRVTVTNIMRLLGLQGEVRAHLESRRLEMGHGRALLPLPGMQQIQAAQEVIDKALSVRATELLVRRLLNPPPKPPEPPEPDADIRRLERELSDTIGARLAIEHRKGGKGRLVIDYSSLEQLDGILAFFGKQPD